MTQTAARLALLGHPVGHSLSPVFQQAALQAAQLDSSYEAIDVPPEALPAMVARIREERLCGNVTVPLKEAFLAHCDVVGEVAARVRAVNTFWCDSAGRLHGENTDVGGFDAEARRLLANRPARDTSVLPPPDDQRVALLGAGGSAAAVCEAIAGWTGASLRIHARTRSRAERLAARHAGFATVAASAEDAVEGATLVVNATPIGLLDDDVPVDPEVISEGAAVLDLVYRRNGTPWVRACRARQLRARDGLGVLVEQGARSFACWFGLVPDREAMWASLLN